jgi:hypothetical protein
MYMKEAPCCERVMIGREQRTKDRVHGEPRGRTIVPIGRRSNGPGKNQLPLQTVSVASLGLPEPHGGLTAEPRVDRVDI